jgi:hypothetical protein
MNAKQVTARNINASLRKLGERVNNLTGGTLNMGGCAVYAALVGAALQRIGLTVGGVVRGWGNDVNVADARRKVSKVGEARQWNRNGIEFNHVGLEYVIGARAYHCDSDYVTPAGRHQSLQSAYPGRLTVDELEALAGHRPNWNHWFDRKLIPQIEAAVAEEFAPYQAAVDEKRHPTWTWLK